MAAVSQTIPNLLGGVSQQPDPVKLPGQVREAVNTYFDPTFGCQKRPPTTFIADLGGSDIPEGAKWINLFRDEREKYVVAIYKNPNAPGMIIRVWDALTGQEKAVNQAPAAADYLEANDLNNIQTLSLADYTLISNKERLVSMSEVELEDVQEEALVVVNAVAYNTNYSIDLSRDGDTEPTKAYKATGLEITPGGYSVNDGGGCGELDSQSFSVDHPTDTSKVGLGFRIVNNCSAQPDGANGFRSQYTSSVVLVNGGAGWRKDDTVTVTMNGREFTIRVTGDKFTYVYASDGTATEITPIDTDGGALTVGDVVSGLSDAVNLIDGYESDTVGNVVRIKRTDNRSFNLATRGGTTNRAMTAIKGTAQDIAQLPTQCFDGFRVKVVNSDSADSDDYYVVFESDSPGVPGRGAWTETTAQNIPTIINSSTMPFALIRQADGTFDFKPLDDTTAFGGWAARSVGDEETNPDPSFIGRGISNMFFYQNRLGLLAEDAVIMSQPGDYFNFWSTSAIAISDADPIDMTAASTKPALLRAAKGTAKGLLLFAENSQFLLTASETVFSPQTVRMNEVSDYNVRSQTQPVSTGISIAYVTESQTHSKIFEMAVDSVDQRPTIAEVTRAVPTYIPTGLRWASASPNNSILMWGDDSETCYVFKFFNDAGERKLAGWSKWVMPARVLLWGFDNDSSYIVTYDGTTYALLQMEMLDNPDSAPVPTDYGSFLPRLDYLHYSVNMTPEPNEDNRTSKLRFAPGAYPGGTPVVFITSGNSAGTFLRPGIQQDATGYYVDVDNDTAASNYVMGIQYRMSVELPAFYVQEQGTADRIDNPVCEFLYLDLYRSGRYQVDIDKQGYPTASYDVAVNSSDIYLANTPILEDVVTMTVPIFSLGRITFPTVIADDPLPAAITSYSWQGHYNKRGIRTLR